MNDDTPSLEMQRILAHKEVNRIRREKGLPRWTFSRVALPSSVTDLVRVVIHEPREQRRRGHIEKQPLAAKSREIVS